jgi:hypothetical protein
MFEPFLVAIIRLNIHSFKIVYNMPECVYMEKFQVGPVLGRGLDPGCGVGRDCVSQVLPFLNGGLR